jgi:hypothetical protein
MAQAKARPDSKSGLDSNPGSARSIRGLWGVRYQVKDVGRAAAFYTQQLGFTLDHEHLPAFAQSSSCAERVCSVKSFWRDSRARRRRDYILFSFALVGRGHCMKLRKAR